MITSRNGDAHLRPKVHLTPGVQGQPGEHNKNPSYKTKTYPSQEEDALYNCSEQLSH